MCEGDPTSITISSNGNPQCLVARMNECRFNMRKMQQIDFDISIRNCVGTWAAPLWISPDNWIAPAGSSGEIDVVEYCKACNGMAINFAGGGNQKQQIQYNSNDFDGHVTVTNNWGNIAVSYCTGTNQCSKNSYTAT